VSDPVIVFEVLSPSTAETDLFAKNAEYRATPSIQRYVVLEPSKAAAIVFARQGEDWLSEILGENDVLRLPEIGLEIPLIEFYADIDISNPPEGETEAA
jgi:Uma2 family endonuclease